MEITNRLLNAFGALTQTPTTKNSVDGNAFLRYGKRMPSTWTTPEISDEDFYTGYGFAVVNKRANRSVVLGKKFLYTEAKDSVVDAANAGGTRVQHPYLKLIKDSDEFTERDFWYDISTYLDLEGVYFLMAVRTVTNSGKVGNVQKFSLLNPYWVRQVVNSDGKLGGYVENNPHLGTREIPKEMIIPIRLLNPFDPTKAYSLADAARDSQFTMKQANDFAREAIDGNLNAPGILSSAIELPDDQFDNFVSRIKDHGRGEPLFGNGSGTVSWVDMQTDLDKAALDKINSINRDTLLAVSGLSKTGVGVEESGTGREVSRTQKDDFTENAVMPQIENIIDSLNLDYRRFYKDEYVKSGYAISLDNPLETDRDAEKVDVEIRDSQFTLFQSLRAQGYSIDIASKYAKGLIDITDLGEPTEEVAVAPGDSTPTGDGVDTSAPDNNPSEDDPKSNSTLTAFDGYPIPLIQYLSDFEGQVNSFTEKSSELMLAENTDKARIKEVEIREDQIVGKIDNSSYVLLGSFNEGADREAIISTLNKRYHNQLVAVKKREFSPEFYKKISELIIPEARYAHAFDSQNQIDQNTLALLQSVKPAEDQLLSSYLNQIAQGEIAPGGTLESYINGLSLPFATWFTVMFSTYASQRAVETAKNLNINDIPITAMDDGVKAQINAFAHKEAESHMNTIKGDLDNALAIIKTMTSDPSEISRMLQVAFADIQKRRAPLIAENAANRIFALSQYEADLQLLTRNGLIGRAFKQLYSSTGDPCSICSYLIVQTNAKPIPFTQEFAGLGDTIEAGGIKMDFNFERIMAGNVHPNCHCYYKIIIEEEVQNSVEEVKIVNEVVPSQISSILEKIDRENGATEETKKAIANMNTMIDEQIENVEKRLADLDKRTVQARQLKDQLIRTTELKSKLDAAEEYAQQLEDILDGQS